MEPAEILLVEDNPSDAKLANLALKEGNMATNVLHLKNGQEALDYIFCEGTYKSRRIDQVPKLILLDLKMPKVNGIEVLRKLKSDPRTSTIPVVIFTSSNEDPDVKECYSLGVNSYIVKPVDFDQLMKAVNEIGLYWTTLNRSLSAM